MSREPNRAKKQSFLEGTAILSVAAIVVKVIGMFYKIPLTNIIGATGNGHFLAAYSIYNVLLTVSTTGLPIAVSRMVSRSLTLGNYAQAQQTYKTSLKIFLPLGAVGALLMLLFRHQLAAFLNDTDAVWSITALAPAVFFCCIISSFRGYFQGQSYMTPTAVSQIIEALCKLFLGLGIVIIMVRLGFDNTVSPAGAILGVTIGSVFSAAYLASQYKRKHIRMKPQRSLQVLDDKHTAQAILRLAIPITIGSTGLQFFNALDTKIIRGRLQHGLGYTQDQTSRVYGVYGAAQNLYMLPAALIQPISISIIPTVTEALTRGSHRAARLVEESAIRLTALIALPCAAGMAVLATPIFSLFYFNFTGSQQAVGGGLLALLGLAVIFNCMTTVTSAILQAHGQVRIPMYTTLIGGLINVITDYVLVQMDVLNIYGAAIATICYCTAIMCMNLAAMRSTIQHPPRILVQFVKPMVATLFMALAAFLSYEGLYTALGSNLVATAISILLAVAVYAAMVLLLRIITWEDCMLMPKGQAIARLLHIQNPESAGRGGV